MWNDITNEIAKEFSIREGVFEFRTGEDFPFSIRHIEQQRDPRDVALACKRYREKLEKDPARKLLDRENRRKNEAAYRARKRERRVTSEGVRESVSP